MGQPYFVLLVKKTYYNSPNLFIHLNVSHDSHSQDSFKICEYISQIIIFSLSYCVFEVFLYSRFFRASWFSETVVSLNQLANQDLQRNGSLALLLRNTVSPKTLLSIVMVFFAACFWIINVFV